jgi:hypothetical protein
MNKSQSNTKSASMKTDTDHQIMQTLTELRQIVTDQDTLIQSLETEFKSVSSNSVSGVSNSKSKAFELESSPITSKSKTKRSPKTNKSVELVDKIVNKTAFFKELASSQFSHYFFEDERHEYNWSTLADYLELTPPEKMSTIFYKACIEKLIDDHIEDGSITIVITKKNIQYILIINNQDDNIIEEKETKSKSKPTTELGYTKSLNGEIVDIDDKEIFSKRVYFSVVEEFSVDNDDMLSNLGVKERTINHIYKKFVDNTITGRQKIGDLFIQLAEYYENKQKSFTIQIENTKTSEKYRYTYSV